MSLPERENIKCKNPLGFGRRPLTNGENKRRGWVWVATEMVGRGQMVWNPMGKV